MALRERLSLAVWLALALFVLSLLYAAVVYISWRDARSVTRQAQADVDREAAKYRDELERWHAQTLREQSRQMAAPFLWGIETLEGIHEGSVEHNRLQRRMSQYVFGRDEPPLLAGKPVGPLESVVIVDRQHRIVASSDPMEVDKRYTDPDEIAALDAAVDSPRIRRAPGPGRDDGRLVLELLTGVPNDRGEIIGVVRMRFVGGMISSLPALPHFEVATKPSFAGPMLAGVLALAGLLFGAVAIYQVTRLTRSIEAMAEGVPLPPTRGPGARALSVIEGKLGILSDTVRRDDLMVASLSEALEEGVVLLDKSGRVVIANRLARELLALGGAHGPDLQTRMVEVRTACPELDGVVVEGLDRGLAVREKTLELRPTGSVIRRLQVNSYVLHDGRRATGLMLVLKDRRRIEGLEKNLREASSLAAIARLTGSFAHEVRNPLGAISVNLENVRRRIVRSVGPDPSAEERVHAIQEEIGRLRGILEEWLRLTGPEERSAPYADVGDVVDSVARLLRVEATHQGVDLLVERDTDPGRVQLSTARLRQVLLNLALNALQAMPGGGRLVLRAREIGGAVALEVEDNGSGIPEELREKIFDFHFTTRTDGSGLGLPICRRLVEQAGGTLSFLSRVGAGTTFTVMLPKTGPPWERAVESGPAA